MKKTIILRFPPNVVDEPIVYTFMKDYGLWVNIHRASVEPGAHGKVVASVEGSEKHITDAISFAEKKGVHVTMIEHDVVLRDGLCINCGACISLCPTRALSLDGETFELVIDYSRCIACGTCATVCPVDAIEVNV